MALLFIEELIRIFCINFLKGWLLLTHSHILSSQDSLCPGPFRVQLDGEVCEQYLQGWVRSTITEGINKIPQKQRGRGAFSFKGSWEEFPKRGHNGGRDSLGWTSWYLCVDSATNENDDDDSTDDYNISCNLLKTLPGKELQFEHQSIQAERELRNCSFNVITNRETL